MFETSGEIVVDGEQVTPHTFFFRATTFGSNVCQRHHEFYLFKTSNLIHNHLLQQNKLL